MKCSLVLALALVLSLAGCGADRAPRDQSMTLEDLTDTTGLTRGRALVRSLEPYRVGNGVLRVRGKVDFPDGTRLQVSILQRPGDRQVQSFQVIVRNHQFNSPPLLGPNGPLPEGEYHFELLAHFNDAWQPAEVLQGTDQGRTLRGPGITRGSQGEAVFRLVQDARL